MTARTVHLGFELDWNNVPSDGPPAVDIPIRHMAVTGQTQESGKTTALTALIARAKLPAIAFRTKRGEGEMYGRKILPFFQERADWQFVQSILESTLKEKMKFERAWIVRACRGEDTLAGVMRRAAKLQEGARNSLSQDVYMLLGEYLKKVVPLIAALPKASKLELHEGLSVMDLVSYPLELQMLVISSTLDWIHRHGNGVIAILPEAWKFIPQGRNTPVRVSAESLIREGAGLRNYVWIDSQDMAAVDKILLRGCPVWLIGVQREANEIRRALANMGAGLKKPKADEVASLELGQFFACYGSQIRKTYVQPAWMQETAARQIASGRLNVHDVSLTRDVVPVGNSTEEMEPASVAGSTVAGESPLGSAACGAHSPVAVQTSAVEEEMADAKMLESIRQASAYLKNGDVRGAYEILAPYIGDDVPASPLPPVALAPHAGDNGMLQQVVARAVELIRKDPVLIRLSQESPAIEVKIDRRVVEAASSSRPVLHGNPEGAGAPRHGRQNSQRASLRTVEGVCGDGIFLAH